jgi:hypothetical protein
MARPCFSHAMAAGIDEPLRRYFTHAIREDGQLASRFRLTMTGQIRVMGLWLPFRAEQECGRQSFVWTARVGPGALTVLEVTDRYAEGRGVTQGRLLGRKTLFRADDQNTTRSAAGRAALEACVFAVPSILPQSGLGWRAESEELIVASWSLGQERPEVRIRLREDGAIRSVSTDRWGPDGRQGYRYIPCGGDVHADRRFGDYTVPSAITVSWWHGTERATPFFRARIDSFVPVSGT